MKFPRPLFLRLALAFSLTLSATFGAVAPFAHEASDLKPDPTVRFGTLPNGLRYAIMPNKEPKGRASLRLLVLAGSLQEEENQRGLAHFLEHMAFNGSQHYAPGTLVEFFQRMGMSFGGDTNASTGFDRTQYLLELPKTDDATLAEGLRVFSDYAGGLLLQPAEIDKERGIILSEKRARDNVQFRAFVAQFEFALGSTRFPKRIPIGQPEIIEKAPRERFVEFWDTWYRPDNMAAIVVGDIDPVAVEKMLVTALSPLKARGAVKAEPDLGQIVAFEGVRTHFHPEPEMPATDITLQSITPYVREPDTAANRIKYLPRQIAIAMLNRRFSELAKKEDAPFSQASAGVSEDYNFLRDASVTVVCKPEQWMSALAVGEQELRRALEHGFQAAELREIIATYTNSLEQSVKTASTRRSGGLANELADSIVDREVFTTPETDRAIYQPALDKVTTADCLAALRSAFSAPGLYVMITGNAKIAGDADNTIKSAYNRSRAVPVAAPAATAEGKWAYGELGAPGTIAKRSHIDDLDVTLVEFTNGVRLNLKKTDFEAGRISLRVRVGNGSITQPIDKRGLDALAGATFTSGGLGKHSVDELRRINAGKNVGVRFNPSNDAFSFDGGTTPGDLLYELQLLTAYLIDPGFRPEALRQAQKGIEQMYLGFEHTAEGPMATEVANLLASGDPRFGVPPKDVMMARNLEEVRDWVTPQLAKGALEIALVGDLDIEATIKAVAQTLGTLPKREARPELKELRNVSFPSQPFTKSYTIASEIPKGNVYVYWPTTDASDVKRTRRLTLLSNVLNDRLRVKIREEIGGSYSPRAGSSASETFPNYGYFQAACIVDPAVAQKISDLIVEIGDDLAKNGVTADELDRARQPALTSIRESGRTNGYWLGSVLSRAQEKPEVLDWARSRESDVSAITAAELSALAKSYLGRDRASRVTVLPAEKLSNSEKAPTGPTGPSAPGTPQ